jgi:AraC-like DNA-binding protein
MQLPEIAVGITHSVAKAPLPAPQRWHGPYRWSSWVIDWYAHPGQDVEIRIGSTVLGSWPRPARSWHIYAPGVGYRHRDEHQPSWYEQLWFFFDLPRPWSVLEDRPLTVLLDEEERLLPHVRAMHELQHHGEPGHELAVHAHALVVLGEIALAARRGGDGSNTAPWRVGTKRVTTTSLMDMIEREVMRDMRHPPTVDELGERLGMSVSSLCHRFKDETGGTVMARVRWLRIREARRLLAEPGATLKDVARRLGFSSQFHLSALFRQITGTTASEHMRRQRP